jgi:N-acetylglucosaminyldiphosphoundecaprenol N-acetyl-beta-D-mannosaminyltransferase
MRPATVIHREPPQSREALVESLNRRYSPRGIGRSKGRRFVQGTRWLLWIGLLAGVKRLADTTFALFLILALFPLLAALYVAAAAKGGGITRSVRLGRWGAKFDLYGFQFGRTAKHGLWTRLPELFNLLKGDLSFIGPRAVAPKEGSVERLAWRRYETRPGLLCLWWIRRRANIDYSTEVEVDAEYVDTQSLRGDFGIALRAIPAALYGGGGTSYAPDRIHLLGITIDNLTMDEAVDHIVGRSSNAGDPAQICFVNADCVNIAARRADYMSLLRTGVLVLGDGIGIKIAGRILNTNIRQNVNGTDLFPRLCAALEQEKLGLFLLGGAPGVANQVAAWAKENYPGIVISGAHHGFFSEAEESGVLETIRQSGAAVLLVAFGAPKQDLWISRNLIATQVRVAVGVGGLFDFYSGRIPRAPVWMRELALEWIYRFIQEPRRMWRRYFVGNAVFLYRVFCYRRENRGQEG